MKVVIIGGGIAGVSLGILLHKLGTDFVINEKESGIPARGNAFLMHADGVSILKKIMGEDLHSIELPGQFIDTFTLKRPDGTELKYIKMEPWQCMRRSSLIEVLYSLIPLEKFKKNRTFLRFLYDDVTGKAI